MDDKIINDNMILKDNRVNNYNYLIVISGMNLQWDVEC